jgi:radical SAM superfamily enzyme YgiQ (UPF0313 family)
MVLIHPPVTRPCEPPAGISRLYGALGAHGGKCLVMDANLEGLLHQAKAPALCQDRWSRRARKNLDANLQAIRTGRAFRDIDVYTKAIREINRALETSSPVGGVRPSLTDYRDGGLSPLSSTDLIRSAQEPRANAFSGYFDARLRSLLEDRAPGVVGFSLNYLSQALTTFAMMGRLRSLDPGIKIVLGGGLVTSWMRRPGWRSPFAGLVDETVAGPGEEFVRRLAGTGSAEKDPIPDYDPFRGQAYLSPGFVLPYSASRGCFWGRCSFCPENAEGGIYEAAAPHRAVAQLQELVLRYRPSLVHILDNAMSPALLSALAASGLPAPWYGFARLSHPLTDPDFCRALRRSGCIMLQLGLESGDQDVLDSLDKGILLEDASLALACLKASGIGTYVYLLFGTPAEDEAAARRTLSFTERHAGLIDFLNLSIFNLPRGSRDAGPLALHDFSEGDLSLYQGFAHPRGWDRARVRRFLEREFRRSGAVRAIVRKDPPLFTSNHAPFFLADPNAHRGQEGPPR